MGVREGTGATGHITLTHCHRRLLKVICTVQNIVAGILKSTRSGGNLAAVAALKASTLEPSVPLVFQLLIVPVTDNTATPAGERHASWKENEHTTWLPAARMIWFQDQYLPNVADRARWDNSPLLAPDELFTKCPPTWIAVAELDVLRDEALAYGEKLKAAGVACEWKVYKGCPHPIMAMDGGLHSVRVRTLLTRAPAIVASILEQGESFSS